MISSAPHFRSEGLNHLPLLKALRTYEQGIWVPYGEPRRSWAQRRRVRPWSSDKHWQKINWQHAITGHVIKLVASTEHKNSRDLLHATASKFLIMTRNISSRQFNPVKRRLFITYSQSSVGASWIELRSSSGASPVPDFAQTLSMSQRPSKLYKQDGYFVIDILQPST